MDGTSLCMTPASRCMALVLMRWLDVRSETVCSTFRETHSIPLRLARPDWSRFQSSPGRLVSTCHGGMLVPGARRTLNVRLCDDTEHKPERVLRGQCKSTRQLSDLQGIYLETSRSQRCIWSIRPGSVDRCGCETRPVAAGKSW